MHKSFPTLPKQTTSNPSKHTKAKLHSMTIQCCQGSEIWEALMPLDCLLNLSAHSRALSFLGAQPQQWLGFMIHALGQTQTTGWVNDVEWAQGCTNKLMPTQSSAQQCYCPSPSPTLPPNLQDAKLQFCFGRDQQVLDMNSGCNASDNPVALLKMELRELAHQT